LGTSRDEQGQQEGISSIDVGEDSGRKKDETKEESEQYAMAKG
jgi:hypothetical protein